MVQKTSMIGLAAILALMDWDFVTSLVSQAATQATLEVGDWKLAHKKETKKTKKTKFFKPFQEYIKSCNTHGQLFQKLESEDYFYG